MTYALTTLVIVVSIAVVNTHVRGDGNGYYAWLASAVVDHDLDFRNQYRHANALFVERYLNDDGTVATDRTTKTGHVENQWAVGPAVLWAPWFAAAHLVIRARGEDPQDGYAPAYRRACAIGTIVYAIIALWLSVSAARRFGVSAAPACLGAATALGASSLLVYTYLLPFHVHALAAFTVALFLWYGVGRAERTGIRHWAVWGGLAGLMAMTYHLDAVFVVVAIGSWGALWKSRGPFASVVSGLAFVASGLVAMTPQWIGKAIVYGSPLATGYRDRFFWTAPELWRTAFSSNHGVILWTPVVAMGVAGWLYLAGHRRGLWGVAAAAGAFYVIVASYENWHGLSSFGNRFFVSWTFLLVCGVSVLADAAWRRGAPARVAVITGLAALVMWNAGLAFQWAAKMVPNRGGVDVRVVAAQQWAVPGRAWSMGRRYVTDRDALIRDIERQDQREWETYRKNQ